MNAAKDDALKIADLLGAAHAAGDTPELQALHTALDEGLSNHAEALGLTEKDQEDIRGILTAARGGEPKPNRAE